MCSWDARARTIFKATKTHATNLMKYVALYKTLLLIQKKANGGKPRKFDTFFAGLVGGYIVFGDRNAINEQVRSTRSHLVHLGKENPVDVCIMTTTTGRAVHLFACNRIIHTPRYPQNPAPYGGYEAHPSKLEIFLRLRCNRLGCGDVAIREQGGDDPTGDVQLDDLPLP